MPPIKCTQSEEGDSPEAGSGVDSKTSAAFETCLKIRGLGVDTAGTLDALSSVLCAASGSVGCGESSAGAEEKTKGREGSPDAASETVVLPNVPVEAVDQNEQDGGTETLTASDLRDVRRNVDRSELEVEGESGVKPPESSSSSPPALWSLEFGYSGLERVLEALETAVSGLIFVVTAASSVGAPESSALWWVSLWCFGVEGGFLCLASWYSSMCIQHVCSLAPFFFFLALVYTFRYMRRSSRGQTGRRSSSENGVGYRLAHVFG